MSEVAANSWPDYRAVWRWHFYAGLFCIPFVVVLSISGSVYLFKQEIESWIDRPYDGLALRGSPAPASGAGRRGARRLSRLQPSGL